MKQDEKEEEEGKESRLCRYRHAHFDHENNCRPHWKGAVRLDFDWKIWGVWVVGVGKGGGVPGSEPTCLQYYF